MYEVPEVFELGSVADMTLGGCGCYCDCCCGYQCCGGGGGDLGV